MFQSEIPLKLTYEQLQFQKFFRGYAPEPPLMKRGQGRRGQGSGKREGWVEDPKNPGR
jgi:hypothetical protein